MDSKPTHYQHCKALSRIECPPRHSLGDMQGYSHLLMGQRFVARLDAGALGILTRNFDF